ncbi:hypothetical protein ANO14919_023640 [Xylariales sp. No.14919]|nr:hypothetical protein ANO14919_023640 [Xylariales sp. No.14919]
MACFYTQKEAVVKRELLQKQTPFQMIPIGTLPHDDHIMSLPPSSSSKQKAENTGYLQIWLVPDMFSCNAIDDASLFFL